MNMPGFDAEASAYRTSNIYHAAYGTLGGMRLTVLWGAIHQLWSFRSSVD
jgi:hypothetical protein